MARQTALSDNNPTPLYQRWWFISAIILSISATLLIAGFAGYYLTGERYPEKYTQVLPLRLTLGEGQQTPESLEIHHLSLRGIAVASGPRMQLPAKHFPILEWRIIRGVTPGAEVFFTWTTSAAPRKTRSLPIVDLNAEHGRLILHTHPHWDETVLAAGLVVRGEIREPLVIQQLRLINPEIPSLGVLLQQLWAEWTAFEGWHGYSINFIIGGADHHYRLLSPVLAAAAWAGLSALLYIGLILMRRQSWNIKPFALFFFAAWLALDARWQLDLWRQLVITRETFAGKTPEEKRLAADDRELFQFAQSIKELLAEKSARIFIISPTLGGDYHYRRARLHYFLLPYNVSARWTKPPSPGDVRPGDYLLFLYPVHEVEYDEKNQILSWERGRRLAVTPLFSSPIGGLFQIR